jgi:hypothetical protein
MKCRVPTLKNSSNELEIVEWTLDEEETGEL